MSGIPLLPLPEKIAQIGQLMSERPLDGHLAETCVGICATIIHTETGLETFSPGVLIAQPGDTLVARSLSVLLDEGKTPAHDILRAYVALQEASLDAPQESLDFEWDTSHPDQGYDMRTIWILPRGAILLDTIHDAEGMMVEEILPRCCVWAGSTKSGHAQLAGRVVGAELREIAERVMTDHIEGNGER